MKLVIAPDGHHVRVVLERPKGSINCAHGFGTIKSAEQYIADLKADLIAFAEELKKEKS